MISKTMKIITSLVMSFPTQQNNLRPHKTTTSKSLEFSIMMDSASLQMVLRIYLRKKIKQKRRRVIKRERKARNNWHKPKRTALRRKKMINLKKKRLRKTYQNPKKMIRMTIKKMIKKKLIKRKKGQK